MRETNKLPSVFKTWFEFWTYLYEHGHIDSETSDYDPNPYIRFEYGEDQSESCSAPFIKAKVFDEFINAGKMPSEEFIQYLNALRAKNKFVKQNKAS